MQVVTFLIVSSISTIVSSSKCKNPELKCIELCCEKTQFYHSLSQQCVDIPDKFIASWVALLNDNTTVSEATEFVEYGECETSILRQFYIASCYSAHLNAKSNQSHLKEFTHVICNRLLKPSALLKIVATTCSCSALICFPIMIVYTCRKGLKDQFTFRLISWYFVSMAAYFAALFGFGLYVRLSKDVDEDVEKIHVSMYLFFFISTYLWQNVIGFEIWSGFKGLNPQSNSDKDQRRCVYYSSFVWGIAAIITSTHFVLSQMNLAFNVVECIMFAMPCFNLLTFSMLSLNICITRCGVFKLTKEIHFKRKLIILILRLGLAMGIPRMVIATLSLFLNVNRIIYTIFLVLEPYVVFTVLVWAPKYYFRLNFGCGCCRKSGKMSKTAEAAYVNTNRN